MATLVMCKVALLVNMTVPDPRIADPQGKWPLVCLEPLVTEPLKPAE